MAPITAESLAPQIRDILESSDLKTVSAKAVRTAIIEASNGQISPSTIKELKSEIDEIIGSIYAELTEGGDDEEDESSEEEPILPKPKKAKVEVKNEVEVPPSSLPIPLKPSKVKPEPKTDEQLARELQAKFNDPSPRKTRGGSSVKKVDKKRTTTKLSKKGHKSADRIVDSDAEDESDDGNNSSPEKPIKKRKRSSTGGGGGGGGGAFNKEMILSAPLANLVKTDRCSRPQAVKRIWDYVKENGLQDQGDKRFINCDDVMFEVMQTKRVHMFSMNKILSKHIFDPASLADQ